jgi:hypothetical protein
MGEKYLRAGNERSNRERRRRRKRRIWLVSENEKYVRKSKKYSQTSLLFYG